MNKHLPEMDGVQMDDPKTTSTSSFLIIWSGQLISSIGSGLTAFALGVYAYQLTHSATVYSLIILFGFLPMFLLNPLGGVLSDRFNRKVMMIVGDLGSTVGLFFILAMLVSGMNQVWVIYVGVSLSSAFVALQNPAYKASVSDLLDREAYSKASGLIQLAESSKFLISPVIAGILLSFLDIKYVLMIDISTFFIAVITVFWVKNKHPQNQPVHQQTHLTKDLLEGFRYVTSHKGILVLLNLTSLITFSVGFLQALLGPMILSFTDSKTLGIILTISASGMLFSSFMIGVFSQMKKHVPVLFISLWFAGIFYLLMGISTNIYFITSAGFLFFITLPFVNTSLEVLIRKNIENNFQGRVWSIVSLISQTGMVIAFCTAGILADHIFNPLFLKDGLLSASVGQIIGTGHGRGIGFMFVLSGIIVAIVAIIISRLKSIRSLDNP